jgi:hypothetical protein
LIVRRLCCGLLAALALCAGEAADGAEAEKEIDFQAEVFPVFQRHCLNCHGEDAREGDLRLHRREFAEQGGHTGSPILGGTVETNAILERVTTSNPALRMPKGEPPLSEQEIEVLRRWVKQGTPWIDPPPPARRDADEPYAFSWETLPPWNPYEWGYRKVERASWYVLRFGPALLAVLCVIMLCERARSWKSRSERESGPTPRWIQRLASIPRSMHLLLVAGWLLALWPAYYQRQASFADRDIAMLREKLQATERMLNPEENNPETPRRPQHPPRLGGEYYRGNDERNKDLFNGGFYRTATLRVSLRDAEGERLEWGDIIEVERAAVRFEIEQAPAATDELFDEGVWQGTWLSSRRKTETTDSGAEFVRFQPAGDRTWVADYPIRLPRDGTGSGTIYLFHGSGSPESEEAPPHYAAVYDVLTADGTIERESELWLSCLYRTANVFVPPEGKIADDEWFSFRPIPEIVGEQTTRDPALLGIEEHRPPRPRHGTARPNDAADGP